MSAARSSPDPALTAEDFANCGWQDALRSTDPWDYFLMWHALSDAARAAEGEVRRTSTLRLLADVCSMKFSPERAAEPFRSRFSGHSFSPDTLTESDTAFLAHVVRRIDTRSPGACLLRARLADLVWLVQEPRSVEFALLAIDSYATVPLDAKTWLRDGLDCWQRALGLANVPGVASSKRRQELEATVLAAFDAATQDDGFLGVKLAELMRKNGLGDHRPSSIAEKLKSLGRELERTGELLPAESSHREAALWFKRAGDQFAETAAVASRAECFVKMADARMSSGDPSHGVAASFLENAIQIYRSTPRSQRQVHQIDERLTSLLSRLRDHGQRAADEVRSIEGPGIDISDSQRKAREAVSEKSATEAIRAFVSLQPWVNVDKLNASAVEGIRASPISALLFPSIIRSRDGRVVAKHPSANLGDVGGSLTDADKIVIRDRMLREYLVLADYVSHALVLPALETLRFEHRFREVDFIEMARQAAIVPPRRSLLFGKGLFAGYDGDFATALHLLAPQIEHMVRFHVSSVGVETRHIDKAGIENEKGLGALLLLPASTEILGREVVFELSALLVEPTGPNFRSLVAHGLLDDYEASFSVHAVYAWWRTLKLMFSYFWNRLSAVSETATETEGE